MLTINRTNELTYDKLTNHSWYEIVAGPDVKKRDWRNTLVQIVQNDLHHVYGRVFCPNEHGWVYLTNTSPFLELYRFRLVQDVQIYINIGK